MRVFQLVSPLFGPGIGQGNAAGYAPWKVFARQPDAEAKIRGVLLPKLCVLWSHFEFMG